MSGITLGDIANEQTMNETMYEGDTLPELEFEQSRQSVFSEKMGQVLTAETGEGSIGDYLDHPLNFSRSMGLAQVIRGVTGVFGNLRLAVVDIIFGALRFSKEKKGAVLNDVGITSRGETS